MVATKPLHPPGRRASPRQRQMPLLDDEPCLKPMAPMAGDAKFNLS
jgi:hypothetical protein